MNDRCFCVFEGGGAKGIAHVGALAALEESGLDLCGFAGTSAGAVIATLAAAGYTSNELINREATVLDLVDRDTTNIWAGDAFKPAHRPSRLFGPGWIGIVAARSGGFLILAPLVLCIMALPAFLIGSGDCAPTSWWWLELMSLSGLGFLSSFVARGLASLDRFEEGLNQLLRLKLARRLTDEPTHRARHPAPVTFQDMSDAGCPPLRIVAADISSRTMKLFSLETTPSVGVASAVAASVCLPVIFAPRRVGNHLHLDGGLVSNLPAWAFDAERALDRDAWTAVVQVGDDQKDRKWWGLGILWAGILTGIFGSGLLNIRNVGRLKSVRIKVRLKVLEFDPGLEVAIAVVDEARQRCLDKLVSQLRDVPEQMTEVCARIQIRTERVINRALRDQGKPHFEGRLRTSLMMPTDKDDTTSLSADFQYGFGPDTDERIRLPIHGSFAGQALTAGEPLYLEHRDPTWGTYLSRPQDRWLKKLIWPEMKWVLCVPHFNAPSGIRLVVAIDSDRLLDVEDDLIDITMSSISDEVDLILDQFLPREAFVDVGT